jgi:hypothetical protein
MKKENNSLSDALIIEAPKAESLRKENLKISSNLSDINLTNRACIKEARERSNQLMSRKEKLENTLNRQRKEEYFDKNNLELLQSKYSDLLMDYQLLEQDSVKIAQTLLAQEQLLSDAKLELLMVQEELRTTHLNLSNLLKERDGEHRLLRTFFTEEKEEGQKTVVEYDNRFEELVAIYTIEKKKL